MPALTHNYPKYFSTIFGQYQSCQCESCSRKLEAQKEYKNSKTYCSYIAKTLGRPNNLELADRHIHRLCTDKKCPVFPACGNVDLYTPGLNKIEGDNWEGDDRKIRIASLAKECTIDRTVTPDYEHAEKHIDVLCTGCKWFPKCSQPDLYF